MARKPKSRVTRRASVRANAANPSAPRDKIIAALMALLAETSFERIELADVAKQAGVSLAELRAEFVSTLAILAAHSKAIDRAVLSGGDAEMADESPRERLFEVLMRRLDLLAAHKEAVRSLLRSARRNPGFALALNTLGVRSQQWMLTAAGIGAAGPRGFVRAQGLALMFAGVLRTWLDDDDDGQAKTLAALDRELDRGQRFTGLLDDLCSIPARLCALRRRASRPRGRGAREAA
jgi:AcrR family transcriptional regulator